MKTLVKRNLTPPFAAGAYPVGICQEGQAESQLDWERILSIDSAQFAAMVESGYFRRLPLKRDGRRRYSMQFVGALFFSETCCIALPKIHMLKSEGVLPWDDIFLTIRAIDQYRLRVRAVRNNESSLDDLLLHGQGARLVDIFRALLRWTDQYGFHEEFHQNQVYAGGAISWPLTIKTRLALHGDSYTTYDRPIIKRRRRVPGDLRNIQAHCIVDLAIRFGPILPLVAGPLHSIVTQAKEVLDFGDPITANSRQEALALREYLHDTNLEHEQRLVKILLAALNLSEAGFIKGIFSYGTTSFHNVWQAVCSNILANISSCRRFKDYSSCLIHHNDEISTDWLLPDHILELETPRNIIIVDSKWHLEHIQFPSGELVKQFMYEVVTANDVNVAGNALLLPSNAPDVELKGEIKIITAGSADDRFSPIRVIGVPWHEALQNYLDRADKGLATSIVGLALRE